MGEGRLVLLLSVIRGNEEDDIQGHYVFFSVLDDRAHLIQAAHYQKENMSFCLPSALIRLLRISEKKQLISGDKKTFRKNKFISRY